MSDFCACQNFIFYYVLLDAAGGGCVSVVNRPRKSPYPMVSVQEAQNVILEYSIKNSSSKIQTSGTCDFRLSGVWFQ